MNSIIKKISDIGIIPVVKIDDIDKAVPLAEALCSGGLTCVEITFRTEQAEEAIKRISQSLPDMLIGAGTVLTTEQVDKAIAAGAKFIVSPGLNSRVVKYCKDKGTIIIPGCANPSDIERAMELELDVVKFFPAEAIGGIKMIRAIAAPYSSIRFMPTGGIDSKNLNDYLAFDSVVACGGSWMVREELIQAGEFNKITEITRSAVQSMLGFDIAHVGINATDEKEAEDTAMIFSRAFGLECKLGNSSIFAGSMVEVMKSPFLGKNGHIAISTNFIKRAVRYLASQGYMFDENTAKYDTKGNMASIYLENEFGGFAVHLIQKNKGGQK